MKKLFSLFIILTALRLEAQDSFCYLGNDHCLSPEETISDFNEIVEKMRHFYGPLSFKQKKYNFTLNELADKTRESLKKSTTDAEAIGLYKMFLASFHDAHITLRTGILGNLLSVKYIPITVLPVDNQFFIHNFDQDLADEGLDSGDEILTIDGKTPVQFLEEITLLTSTGYDLANFRLSSELVFYRPSFAYKLYPKADSVDLLLKKSSGETYELSLVWRRTTLLESQENNSKDQYPFSVGNPVPFFINSVTSTIFDLKRVVVGTPKDGEATHKNGAPTSVNSRILPSNANDSALVEAYIYRFQGKNILLVRQSTYSVGNPNEIISYYRKLFKEFHNFVDVLVIDQTNNGGGSISYATDFFRLFVENRARNVVFKMNNDLAWLQQLTLRSVFSSQKSEETQRIRLIINAIKDALIEKKKGKETSFQQYFPLYMNSYIKGDQEFQWKKPVLVLINELDASSADIVPLLFKGNSRAKLFGERTMGAGGNVEDISNSFSLPHTGMSLSLTRSLFTLFNKNGTYSDDEIIENQGVTPDFPYTIKKKDIDDSFFSYFYAFSEAAVALTEEKKPQGSPLPITNSTATNESNTTPSIVPSCEDSSLSPCNP